MEGRGEFKAAADYLVLAHGDKRRFDADGAVARAGADELLKGLVVGGTAVGIAGAVLLDGADVDGLGAEHLCPTDGGGEEVRVAEGNIGDGNAGADSVGVGPVRRRFGDGDAAVGKGGAADDAEEVDGERKELCELEFVGDGAGGLELALLGALAIAEVQGVGLVLLRGDGGADGGVHAAGEADDGAGCGAAGGGRSW